MDNKNIEKYDLVVIGGGPAGTPVAMEYATLNPNKKILLIDKKGELGGECLFDGCIPSKILEITGKYIIDENKLDNLGILHDKSKIDWNKIISKKKEILNKRTKAAKEKLMSFGNIELIKGNASFIDKNTINIEKIDSSSINISFKKVVIGTGSRTFIPQFKGNGVQKAWTNVDFFDKMELPKNLTIIGDGPIGIELSQILSSLGVSINLIGDKNIILPMIEEKYSNIIKKKIKNDPNINLILNVNVEEINYNESSDSFNVKYLEKETNFYKNISSSKVLIATGRTPNIEKLNLDSAGIKYENRGIVVDKYLQTTNKNIYACGDVALHFPQFAHTASYGAHIVTQNLFFERNKFKVDFDKNTWVLFSNPNFSSAGLSEQQAKNKGFDVIIDEYDFSIDAKAQIEEEDSGFMKFIVNKKNLQILGINIIHENANNIGGEAALIVSNKLTLLDLVNTIHSHPTYTESFGFLAKQMMGKIMQERMKNPMFKIGFFIKKWL